VSTDIIREITSRITIPVVSREGTQVGQVEIDPGEFGGKINRQVLHDVVVMYLANQRAGTHSTLRPITRFFVVQPAGRTTGRRP